MSAGQATTKAPDANEYGGDEISALVLDPGYSTIRAGFAGEDVPKSIVPSFYGIVPGDSGDGERQLFGDNAVNTPIPKMRISNCMSQDGTVQDWDTATKLWEYAITSKLTSTSRSTLATNGLNDADNQDVKMEDAEAQEKLLTEHALLMTEPGWNAGKDREKALENAMENWGTPAFWLARNAVLAGFSAGRPSALVIDIGACGVSVSPVHDGILLRKGVTRSPLGGDFLSNQVRMLFLSSKPQVPLTPHYLISSKSPVGPGAPPQAQYRTFASDTAPEPSFRVLQEDRVLTDFKESVVAVWSGPGRLSGSTPDGTTHIDLARQHPGKAFETPEGYNSIFAAPDRYRCAEGLFEAKMALSDDTHPEPSQEQTLIELVKRSLNCVDTDIKPHLLSQVIVTGGGSLIQGLNERLLGELQATFQGMKIRVHSPSNLAERRFGSWIGGSILASLGTFHQMWISKKEYEEFGSSVIEKRCR